MRTTQARILAVLGSVAILVVLFVVLVGGDDETTTDEPTVEATSPDADQDPIDGGDPNGAPEPKPEPEPDPQPEAELIEVSGGEPVGGVREIEVAKGDRVKLEVRSDTADHVHVHGYDFMEDVAAGGKAKFDFTADIDGIFEVELEDSGVQLAELRVNP